MAGILSKTQSLFCNSLKAQPSIPLTLNRHRSFKPELVEISLATSSSSSSSSATSSDSDADARIKRKLEDMIHRIAVQNSTPDWLPFIPGSSFWVPPTRPAQSYTIANFVTKLANHMTEEESLSFVTPRGWPCSSVLIQSEFAKKEDGIEMVEEDGGHVDLQVVLFPNIENNSQHENEEE